MKERMESKNPIGTHKQGMDLINKATEKYGEKREKMNRELSNIIVEIAELSQRLEFLMEEKDKKERELEKFNKNFFSPMQEHSSGMPNKEQLN